LRVHVAETRCVPTLPMLDKNWAWSNQRVNIFIRLSRDVTRRDLTEDQTLRRGHCHALFESNYQTREREEKDCLESQQRYLRNLQVRVFSGHILGILGMLNFFLFFSFLFFFFLFVLETPSNPIIQRKTLYSNWSWSRSHRPGTSTGKTIGSWTFLNARFSWFLLESKGF
jgi:hypothetical protein